MKTYLIKSEKDLNKASREFCFMVGKNGVFRNNIQPGKWHVIQPVHATEKAIIPGLLEIETKVKLFIDPMSVKQVREILGFLRHIRKTVDGSEAGVFLYYNTETKDWAAKPPKQAVTPHSVDYTEQPPAPDGYDVIGTAHSHPDFGASHSGIDRTDHMNFPGIHMTFGNIGQVDYELVMSLFVGQKCYKCNDPFKYIPHAHSDFKFPAAWADLVEKDTKVIAASTGSSMTVFSNPHYQGTHNGNASTTVKPNNRIKDEDPTPHHQTEIELYTKEKEDVYGGLIRWIKQIQKQPRYHRTMFFGEPFGVDLEFNAHRKALEVFIYDIQEDPITKNKTSISRIIPDASWGSDKILKADPRLLAGGVCDWLNNFIDLEYNCTEDDTRFGHHLTGFDGSVPSEYQQRYPF